MLFEQAFSNTAVINMQIYFQNVVAWTNLGTLYLKKGNIEVSCALYICYSTLNVIGLP